MPTLLGINSLQVIDTKDDRREIWHLLSKLTLAQRTGFIQHCVDQINTGIMLKTAPPWVLFRCWSETGDVNETYVDLMTTIAQYSLPVDLVLRELERFVVKIVLLPGGRVSSSEKLKGEK